MLVHEQGSDAVVVAMAADSLAAQAIMAKAQAMAEAQVSGVAQEWAELVAAAGVDADKAWLGDRRGWQSQNQV